MGTRLEVIRVEFIKACASQPRFLGGFTSRELLATIAGQEMPDDGSGKSFAEL